MPRRPAFGRSTIAADGSGELLEKFQASLDPEWIEEALQATGTATVRRGRLPAARVIWLVLGMGIYRNKPITEIRANRPRASRAAGTAYGTQLGFAGT